MKIYKRKISGITSSLRAVVHDCPKGALGPSLAVATGVCCGQLQEPKSLYVQTF